MQYSHDDETREGDIITGGRVLWVRDPGAPSVQVTEPEHVAEFLAGVIDDHDEREHFIVVLLDVAGAIKGYSIVSVGTLGQTLVHPREVFRPAIIGGAASIIVAHNHPSGNLEPSSEDISITRRLGDAGRLLGIEVLDHLILAPMGKWASLRGHIQA